MHTPARLSISSLRQMRPSTEQDRGGGGGGSGGAFGPPLARTNVFQGSGGDGGRPGSHASTHSMSSGMSGGAGSRLFSPQQRQLSPSPTAQRPGPPTHSVSYSAVSSSFLEGAAGATSPRPVPQRSKTAGPPDLTTSVYSPTVSHSAPSSNSTHFVRPSFSASLNNPPHPRGAGGGGQGDWAGLASGNGPPLPALSLKREPQSPMLLVSPDNVVRTEAGGESGMAGVGRRAFAKATAQAAQAQTLMSAGSECERARDREIAHIVADLRLLPCLTRQSLVPKRTPPLSFALFSLDELSALALWTRASRSSSQSPALSVWLVCNDALSHRLNSSKPTPAPAAAPAAHASTSARICFFAHVLLLSGAPRWIF